MAGFDFQALAARARADNPDAALLDAIERDATARGRERRAMATCPKASRDELRRRLSVEWLANREKLAAARPATLEGLLAKLRHVSRQARGRGVCGEYAAALDDAIAWLEPPKPKRRRGAVRTRPTPAGNGSVPETL